jgi:hypothetical protein
MTRETRFRVFVVLALLAGGVALFAVEIAATFAAPIEGRSQWWFRGRLDGIGGHVIPRKTFDPAASRQSNTDPITGSSTGLRPAPVDSGHDDILRLLRASGDSGLCTGEAARTTRPDVTQSSNRSSAIGLRCRLDNTSSPR